MQGAFGELEEEEAVGEGSGGKKILLVEEAPSAVFSFRLGFMVKYA